MIEPIRFPPVVPPDWLSNWAVLNDRKVVARGKNWEIQRAARPDAAFFVSKSMSREEFMERMRKYYRIGWGPEDG